MAWLKQVGLQPPITDALTGLGNLGVSGNLVAAGFRAETPQIDQWANGNVERAVA